MTFYFYLLILLTLILFLSQQNKKTSSLFLFLFFTISFVIAGFRGDVGQDTLSYGNIYAGMIDLDALKFVLIRQEPFFNVLMYLHKQLFDNYSSFLVLVSLLQFCLLYYVTREMHHKLLFLFLYLIIFYFELHFNIQRVSFAVLFFLISLIKIKSKPKQAVFFAFMALLSHVSILVVFPILIARIGLSIKKFILIIIFSLVIVMSVLFFFGDLILIKIGRYSFFDFSGFTVPKVSLFLVVVLLSSMLPTKKIKFEIIVACFVFSVFLLASSISEIAYRFYYIAMLVLFFLVLSERNFEVKHLKFKPIVAGIFCITLWFGFTGIQHVVTEKEKRTISGEGSLDFTYIPYSFFYNSKYRN